MSRPSMTIDDHTIIGRRSRLLFGLCALCTLTGRCWGQQTMPDDMASAVTATDDAAARAIYSPLLDYNNVWTPIGHGDPLKTPTVHDYSPPQLDRVRYWAETGAAAESGHHHSAPSSSAAALNALLGSAAGYQSNRAAYHNPHSNVVHKTKSDILLLGVPATKRAAQFKSVDAPTAPRRNYYGGHQLPTVLMPPPMQTLMPPLASGGQQQQQQRPYHHYSTPAQYQNQWPVTDAHPQESSPYISSVLPDPNTVTLAPARKKPWIQALLQKEVTPPVSSDTTTTTIVSMVPASPVYESHITQEVHAPSATVRPPMSTVSYTIPPTPTTMMTYSHPSLTVVHHHHHLPPPQPHLSNHIFATTMWDTTTHFTPTVRPHMVPSAAATASSTPSATSTDSMFSHYKHRPVNGPAYMIIEGHSKVKTYGNSPAGRHEPNVRPVQSTVDPVVVELRPLDERAEALRKAEEERRFEVRHLHYKQPPSAEQQEDERQTAKAMATTTMATAMTTLEQAGDDEGTVFETTTTMPSRMSAGLLSLLDTSFGDFFSDNETDDVETETVRTKTTTTTATPTKATTRTSASMAEKTTATTTTTTTTTSTPEATTDNAIDNTADLEA